MPIILNNLLDHNHPHSCYLHLAEGTAVAETSTEAAREQADEEIAQLFLPYRGFFARKGVRL